MATTDPSSREDRQRATFLRDDPSGVVTENRQRRVQAVGGESRRVSLNQYWASTIGINSQSAPTTHYLITGTQPVIITEPAIVIQRNGGEMGGD